MKGLLFLLISITIVFSCKKDNNSTSTPIKNTTVLDCSKIQATYTNDVKAIMDNSCAIGGCHNTISKANGIDLSNYAVVKTEAALSRFLGSIKHQSGFDVMPRNSSKLNQTSIDKIECWIKNGFTQ